MNEQVWKWATELWEKREKYGLEQINVYLLYLHRPCDEWNIRIWYNKKGQDGEKIFTTEAEVHQFLDGLEG